MQRYEAIGRLGTEPEMRYTPSGTAVTNFSVAINEKYTDSNGEEHKTTVWIRCTAWGKLAEICKEFLSKKQRIYFEGKLVPDPETGGPRIWGEDEPRASYDVRLSYVEFLDGGEDRHESTPYDEEEERPAKKSWKKSEGKTKGKPAWQK